MLLNGSAAGSSTGSSGPDSKIDKDKNAMALDVLQRMILAIDKIIALSDAKNDLIVEQLYQVSWRSHELSWACKYSYLGAMTEHAWHVLEFLAKSLQDPNNITALTTDWVNIKAELVELNKVLTEIVSLLQKNIAKKRPAKPVAASAASQLVVDAPFDLPVLSKVLMNAFNEAKSAEIFQCLAVLHSNQPHFDINNPFHRKAVMKTLESVGEICKRFTEDYLGSLSENIRKLFILLKDIRDSSEKVSYAKQLRIENATSLINDLFLNLIAFYTQYKADRNNVSVVLITQLLQCLNHVLAGLDEKSQYLPSEQLSILQMSFDGEQNHRFSLLNLTTPAAQDICHLWNLQETKAVMPSKASTHAKVVSPALIDEISNSTIADPLKKELLRQLRSPKVVSGAVAKFVKAKQIDLSGYPLLKAYLDQEQLMVPTQQNDKDSELFRRLLGLSQKLTDLKPEPEQFAAAFNDAILREPDLFPLSTQQTTLLKAMRHNVQLSEADVDSLLTSLHIDEPGINTALGTQARPYTGLSFKRKVSYKVPVSAVVDKSQEEKAQAIHDMKIILVDISMLATLATGKAVGEQAKQNIDRMLTAGTLEFLAAQKIMKMFGHVFEEHRDNFLFLQHQYENISARQLFLLVAFRQQLAHRSTDINSHELAWFFARWVSLAPAELRKRRADLVANTVITTQPQRFTNRYITREELTLNVKTIRSLASALGFEDVVLFYGKSVRNSDEQACDVGIQGSVNLIVTPAQSSQHFPASNLFELQYLLSLHFNMLVKINTWESIQTDSTLRDSDRAIIKQTAEDIYHLHLQKIQRDKLAAWQCLRVRFNGEPKSVEYKAPLSNADLRRASILHFSVNSEWLEEIKHDRQIGFTDPEVTKVIRQKAQRFANSLVRIIADNKEIKPDRNVIMQFLYDTMVLHQQLDQYFEENFARILSFDPMITRHAFKQIVKINHNNIHAIMRENSALSASAVQLWQKNGNLIGLLTIQKNYKTMAFLAKALALLDEVRNPEIAQLLRNEQQLDDASLKAQVAQLVESDFKARYLDPFETTGSMMHFLRVSPIHQIIMPITNGSFIKMVPIGLPVVMPSSNKKMVKHGFSTEVNTEARSAKGDRMRLLEPAVHHRCIEIVEYLATGHKKPTAADVCTVDNIADLVMEYSDIQRLDGVLAPSLVTFYPEPKTLSELLASKGITELLFPNFNQNEFEYNAFMQVKSWRENLIDLERQYIYYQQQINEHNKAIGEYQDSDSSSIKLVAEVYIIQKYQELCELIAQRMQMVYLMIFNSQHIQVFRNKISLSQRQVHELLLEELVDDVEISLMHDQRTKPYVASMSDYKNDLKQRLYELQPNPVLVSVVSSSTMLNGKSKHHDNHQNMPKPMQLFSLTEELKLVAQQNYKAALRVGRYYQGSHDELAIEYYVNAVTWASAAHDDKYIQIASKHLQNLGRNPQGFVAESAIPTWDTFPEPPSP